ncbi:MAG: hypothetical protein ACK53L_09035, partial [Pirellulaceae bacterium]
MSSPSQRSVREGRQPSFQRDCRGGLAWSIGLQTLRSSPPQPRYRWLTLPQLRLGRVTMVAISEK